MELRLTKVEKWRVMRERKGLTQRAVAEGIGIDNSNLAKYEKQKLVFPDHVWQRYTDFINSY